jgi:hypothetical protein
MEISQHLSVWRKLRIFFFELPKLPSKFSSDYAPGNWLLAFKAKTDEDLARLAACGDPIMKKLVESYYSVVGSNKFNKLALMRKMASCDLAQALNSAEKKGEKKGEKKARARTRAEFEPIVERLVAENADKDKTIAALMAENALLSKKRKWIKS